MAFAQKKGFSSFGNRKKPFSSFSSFGKKRTPFGQSPGFGKKPAGSGRYIFTLHSEYKMREYHLSRQRVTRIIRSPKRIEEGIVEDTVAVMQPASLRRVNGKETWSQEIWVMYKVQSKVHKQEAENEEKNPLARMLHQPQLKIISAWRYPGVSPARDPIPADILREIADWNTMEGEEGEV
ncbi:MAG: hypothetical protein ABI747_03430 [Candidatus Moraniibacteriota bacterium]